MKNIIFTMMIGLAFSLSANAQDTEKKKVGSAQMITSSVPEVKKQDVTTSSKQLAYEMGALLKLNDTQVSDFISLLKMKQEIMSNERYTLEKRKDFMESFKAKIRASLDEKSFEILMAKKDLYNKLVEIPEEAKK